MKLELNLNEQEISELVKVELVKQIVAEEYKRDYDNYASMTRIAQRELRSYVRDYFREWLKDNIEQVKQIIEKVITMYVENSAYSHCGVIGKELRQNNENRSIR